MQNHTEIKSFGIVNADIVNDIITTLHSAIYDGFVNDICEELIEIEKKFNLSLSNKVNCTISVYNEHEKDLKFIDNFLIDSGIFSRDERFKTYLSIIANNLETCINNFSVRGKLFDIRKYYKNIEIKLNYQIPENESKITEKPVLRCQDCIFYDNNDVTNYITAGEQCLKGYDMYVDIAGKEHHLFSCSNDCFLSKNKCDIIINTHKKQIENEINELIKSNNEKVEIDLNYKFRPRSK